MSDIVQTAVVVGAFSILTILANGWIARATKEQEWERQDEVAASLEIARKESLEAQKALLVETKRGTEQAEANGEALQTIHTLVNSTLTSSMQAELASTRREVVLLEGADDGPAVTNALVVARARIDELVLVLEERARQQAIVDHQQQPARATPTLPSLGSPSLPSRQKE
jgi:hypothetical protein